MFENISQPTNERKLIIEQMKKGIFYNVGDFIVLFALYLPALSVKNYTMFYNNVAFPIIGCPNKQIIYANF